MNRDGDVACHCGVPEKSVRSIESSQCDVRLSARLLAGRVWEGAGRRRGSRYESDRAMSRMCTSNAEDAEQRHGWDFSSRLPISHPLLRPCVSFDNATTRALDRFAGPTNESARGISHICISHRLATLKLSTYHSAATGLGAMGLLRSRCASCERGSGCLVVDSV